ncbi:radical SAM protein [Lachnospiraceae bacterium JLR.KK008]
MQSDLGRLSEDWKEINEIVLYGAGTVSKICKGLFEKVNVNIICVIDQDTDKQGKEWNGIPIISYTEAKEKIIGKKIVVMTAHAAYNDISVFLDRQGLTEFEDYCRLGQFICEWFWNARGMNCVYHVDMTVTTKCTFNCQGCNMFIPYYEKHFHYTLEQLKRNIDQFFSRIDYVVYFGLIGGEPMLNPVLKDVIVYLEENYGSQFGTISYASNGSVLPSYEILEVMKKYGTHIVVSDYSDQIPYQERLDLLEARFKEYGIHYDRKPSIIWCDFGFPESPFRRNEIELKEHLACCRPEWNGLNDGKFYYCNVSWSAEKSGRYKLCPEDYIILEEIDPEDKYACHKLVELSRGTSSFCRICGGCGKDNTNYIPAGLQINNDMA